MKTKILVLLSAVVLAGGGCVVESKPATTADAPAPAPQVVEKVVEKPSEPVHYAINGAVSLDVPAGLSIWAQQALASTNGIVGLNILSDKYFKVVNDPQFQGEVPPPFLSIETYQNKTKLSAEEWARKNKYLDNQGKTEIKPLPFVVGDKTGIKFVRSADMYGPEIFVVVNSDKSQVVVISKNGFDKLDLETTEYLALLQKVLDSVKIK